MQFDSLNLKLEPVPGAAPAFRVTVNAVQWLAASAAVRADGGYLVALWGSD